MRLFSIASATTILLTLALYAFEAAVPAEDAQPGSLRYGSSLRIMAWIEMSTCKSVDVPATQPGPLHVPSRDRQTLPSACGIKPRVDCQSTTPRREASRGFSTHVEVRVESESVAVGRHRLYHGWDRVVAGKGVCARSA